MSRTKIDSSLIAALSSGQSSVNAAGYIKGTVVQSVQVVDTSFTNTGTGGTYTTTTTAATITPLSTTHRIRITVTATMNSTAFSTSNTYASIFRGSTDLEGTGNGFVLISGNTGTVVQVPTHVQYLDSPVTTSSTTYTLKVKSDTTAKGTWNGNGSAVILIEEIAY